MFSSYYPIRKKSKPASFNEDIPYIFKISFSDIIRFCELSHDTRGCQDTSSTQLDADINWYKLTTEAIQDSTVRPKATNVVYDLNVVYYAYGKYTCTHVHNIMYVYMHLNMVVL